MKKAKAKTYTQKEYDACRVEWFERGIKEGQQQLKRKFHELFGLSLCPEIEEGSYEDDEEEGL